MNSRNAPPVVLVTGGDRYAVMERFHARRDALGAAIAPVLGIDDFEGDDTETVASALDAARTPAMFGATRFVVLRHGVSDASVPVLKAYAERPCEAVSLLLVHVKATPAVKGLADLVKAVKAGGGEVDEAKAPPDRQRDLAAYVAAEASSHGVSLRPDAAAYLAAHIGPNAGAIGGVVQQLATAYGDRHVDRRMVAAFVSGPTTAKTWDLTDAIDAGDVPHALRTLRSLMVEMHPLQLQAVLVGHVRRTLAATELRPRSPGDLERDLDLKPYPAKKLFAAARRLAPSRIRDAHSAVAEADIALRGASGLSNEAVLELLVARLADDFALEGQNR